MDAILTTGGISLLIASDYNLSMNIITVNKSKNFGQQSRPGFVAGRLSVLLDTQYSRMLLEHIGML
jgi:hypothetical protein